MPLKEVNQTAAEFPLRTEAEPHSGEGIPSGSASARTDNPAEPGNGEAYPSRKEDLRSEPSCQEGFSRTKDYGAEENSPAAQNTAEEQDKEALPEQSLSGTDEAPKGKKRQRKTQNPEKLAETTEKMIDSSKYIFNKSVFGLRIYFRAFHIHENEFIRDLKRVTIVTPLCTSAQDLDKEPDKEEFVSFFNQMADFFYEQYPHFGSKSPKDAIWFYCFRFMIPHDLESEYFRDFLKEVLEILPYEEGRAFFAAFHTVKDARFLTLYISNRQYHAEQAVIPVQIAKQDLYYDSKTGRRCTSEHPNAVLKCKKGTVTRTILSHFGFKQSLTMKKRDFWKMRQAVVDFMIEFFKAHECKADQSVLLARYQGDELKDFFPSVRHRNARYNSMFRDAEDRISGLYSLMKGYNDPLMTDLFKETVFRMRRIQCNDINVPSPEGAAYVPGTLTVAFGGSGYVFKQNLEMMKEKLEIEIERFQEIIFAAISRISAKLEKAEPACV